MEDRRHVREDCVVVHTRKGICDPWKDVHGRVEELAEQGGDRVKVENLGIPKRSEMRSTMMRQDLIRSMTFFVPCRTSLMADEEVGVEL